MKNIVLILTPQEMTTLSDALPHAMAEYGKRANAYGGWYWRECRDRLGEILKKINKNLHKGA